MMKLSGLSVSRPLTFFCAALLAITAATVCSWVLFSYFVAVPTPEQAGAQYGVVKGLIRPEPVENYTFLAALLLAGPIICAAARFSLLGSEGRDKPVLVDISLITLIAAAVWAYWMDWTSIVPPAPANALVASLRHHVFGFLGCVALFTLILLREDQWSKRKRQTYITVILTILSLFGLSRLVLMSNLEQLVVYPHYEAFIYPIVQDWVGHGIYLNQKSLYGLYPIFLRPLWMLTGGPHTTAVCFAMGTLLFFVHAAFVGFMYRFNRHKNLAVIFTLTAIVFTLLFYPFWPGETYFQHFPIRLVFPAIALGFICLESQYVRRPYLAYAVLSFGWFWNLEGGTVAILTFAVFQLARYYRPPLPLLLKTAFEQAALAVSGLILAGSTISLYYLYRFHSAPHWTEMFQVIRLYPAGLFAEPMPMWGAWAIHVVIYLGALFVAFRALFDPALQKERERYAAMLALAVMGIIWLRYYQGRSVALSLVFVSTPAIMCLGMLVDIGISRLRSGGYVAVRTLRLGIGAPLLSALLFYFASGPERQRTWANFVEQTPYPLDETTDRIRADFDRVKHSNTDEVFVIAPYAHLFQLSIGRPNPLPALGMCALWFEHDVEDVASRLRDHNIRMAVFDSNSLCRLFLDSSPRISSILKTEFDTLRTGEGCSEPSYRAYVRKGDTLDRVSDSDGPNLALGKAASQSSEFGATTATAAIDGNTDGRYEKRSVTHTGLDTNAWWQVDLGISSAIDSVVVWNRTDCCSDRLKNYWLFVSDTPFGTADTPDTLRHRAGTWSHYEMRSPCPNQRISANSFRGRYVRVQLAGQQHLSLAEVQILGAPGRAEIK